MGALCCRPQVIRFIIFIHRTHPLIIPSLLTLMATSTYSTLFSYDVLERALLEKSVLIILPVLL